MVATSSPALGPVATSSPAQGAVATSSPAQGAVATSSPTLPGEVASVTASRKDGSIVAGWDAASDATSYDVVYSTNDGASWKRAATSHAGTSYTLANADGTKAYIVGVRAVNSAGESGWTNSDSVPAPTPLPGGVGTVKATHNGDSVSASWQAAEHATGYDVVYSTDNRISWKRAATNHEGTSYTLKDADRTKTYIFGVRAVNAAGEGNWTNSAPAAR